MKRKKSILLSAIVLLISIAGIYNGREYFQTKHPVGDAKIEVGQLIKNDDLKNGDLIFQTSSSGQSKAIQLATKSKYSHCGMIFRKEGEFFVYEAIQPVMLTSLAQWIARGENGRFVIKRLRNADDIITKEVLDKMILIGNEFKGKNYDFTFEWSDERIYCSELIWKIYHRATGIEIGKPEKLGDFDLSNPIVKAKLMERYGDSIPLDEIVISPAAVFESDLLVEVQSN